MPYYACMWHIWTNVRSKFKKGHLKLSELYFATTRSYMLDKFNERMSNIEEIDTRIKAYLYDIGYHGWSRVYAMVNRTWTMTSNIADSLNELDELSCAHALAALRHRNESYTNYCSPYYTRESLLQTYEIPVDPLPDESK
ncbi:uncharacterized protein [Nicotiana tomentosiformis]|uniref:uncharacterized protein n=1 Tax=Nicotiana tomentosiformis TaxID=4098 RepID=UPI00388C9998